MRFAFLTANGGPKTRDSIVVLSTPHPSQTPTRGVLMKEEVYRTDRRRRGLDSHVEHGTAT